MNCKEAERLVSAYIRHELDEETEAAFVGHVDTCPACMEELEVYYFVESGMRYLEAEEGLYDIKSQMAADLAASRTAIRLHRHLRRVRYAMDTLIAMGVTLMFLLQLRLWFW